VEINLGAIHMWVKVKTAALTRSAVWIAALESQALMLRFAGLLQSWGGYF